jgi:hypothetical protein
MLRDTYFCHDLSGMGYRFHQVAIHLISDTLISKQNLLEADGISYKVYAYEIIQSNSICQG